MALVRARETIQDTLGYRPITDVALLAGTLLLAEGRQLEIAWSVDLLKAIQRQDPSFVRFTVDRMGGLAYVKFLKSSPGAES